MRKTVLLAAATAVTFMSGFATAAEIEVKMLNKGERGAMVFEPALVLASVGDTIKFVATDKSHNAEAIKGMLPEGAAEFKGKTNDDVSFVVEKDGIYGVKCAPHYGMGMVALVVAGEPANLEAAKAVKHSGKAKKVFAELFDELAASQ